MKKRSNQIESYKEFSDRSEKYMELNLDKSTEWRRRKQIEKIVKNSRLDSISW